MASRLVRSTFAVSGLTLLSRVTGFVRDVVVAYVFGAGAATDAFFVAFKIPNFFRRLFGEGAFAQAFVPVLAHYRERGDAAATRAAVARVAGSLGATVLAFGAFGVLAAPLFVLVFAPGFWRDEAQFALATDLLRWTFPYLPAISLTALSGAILNAWGVFSVPAFTPVLLNLALITAALGLAPTMEPPVMALAIGVAAAGVLQLAFQLPALARLRLLPRPRVDFRHPAVRRIVSLMGPAVFGASVTQLNLLIDTLLASFLVGGSVSWLYYSDRLVEFPLGVFGIALGTVLLPALSRSHVRGHRQHFSDTLDWGLRWVLVVGVPAALGLAVLARPILFTLFQYGALEVHDVQMAGRSLAAYAVGLVGFMGVRVLAPGFFARQDTRTPVRAGVRAVATNIALNLALIVPLAHAGLALATSVAAWVNAGWLLRELRRQGVYRAGAGWGRLLLQVLIAAAAMAAVLLWLARPDADWAAWGAAQRGLALGGLIAAGTVVYALMLLLAGVRPRALATP